VTSRCETDTCLQASEINNGLSRRHASVTTSNAVYIWSKRSVYRSPSARLNVWLSSEVQNSELIARQFKRRITDRLRLVIDNNATGLLSAWSSDHITPMNRSYIAHRAIDRAARLLLSNRKHCLRYWSRPKLNGARKGARLCRLTVEQCDRHLGRMQRTTCRCRLARRLVCSAVRRRPRRPMSGCSRVSVRACVRVSDMQTAFDGAADVLLVMMLMMLVMWHLDTFIYSDHFVVCFDL